MAFTLDTSGTIFVPTKAPLRGASLGYEWSDLTPFAQGYVEAMFASAEDALMDEHGRSPGFRHLAPATLSRIIGDCERYEGEHRVLQMLGGGERTFGRALWVDRQEGKLPAYPVLTVSLGEDGLIYLREAGQ